MLQWIVKKYKSFKKNNLEKAIKKNAKTVRNQKAIREDRVGAIDYFKALQLPEHAIPALLARFEFSLEHGINDTREKEAAMEGILKFKEAALPYLEKHLHSSSYVAWPIKMYSAIASQDQLCSLLESCLNYDEVSFDQSKTDKNYDILCYLRDYKLADHGRKITHFIKDHDERIRFAAAEILLEQDDKDVARELEPFISDSSAILNNLWI